MISWNQGLIHTCIACKVTYPLLNGCRMMTFFVQCSTEETFLNNFPSGFRYLLALREASVIAIAEGLSQARGGPTPVNVQTGAGLGNAMGNVITASGVLRRGFTTARRQS